MTGIWTGARHEMGIAQGYLTGTGGRLVLVRCTLTLPRVRSGLLLCRSFTLSQSSLFARMLLRFEFLMRELLQELE